MRVSACTAVAFCVAGLCGRCAAFEFQADVAGWQLTADESSVSLLRPDTGLKWRTPLPQLALSKRAAGVSSGCWKHTRNEILQGGETSLASGSMTPDGGVALEGGIMLPSGTLEHWKLQFGVGVAGSLRFQIDIGNKTGEGIQAQSHCGLVECYKYGSWDVSLPWILDESERILGGGEQYSTFDLRGQKFRLWSGEQCIGRGRRPVTEIIEAATHYCGGDEYSTYSHVPVFLSTRGYGVVLENHQLMEVDFQSHTASVTVAFEGQDNINDTGVRIEGHLLAGADVRSLLTPLTEITGRMVPPPQWAAEGLVIGTEGGHRSVDAQLEKLLTANVSVAGVWIQDWSGLVESLFADHVWWNWELDESRYPKSWFKKWSQRGVRVLTYASPYLATAEATGRPPRLYEEAKRLDYLVKNGNGEIFLQKQPKIIGGTDAAVVDLVKPEAFEWWTQILRCNVLMACEPDGGPPLVHGWMNDYGEWFPMDAAVSSMDESAATRRLASDFHNTFGRLSAAAAQKAIEVVPNTTFWARSGDLLSPGKTAIFWAGDQIVNWDACDGMQSALIGIMSGGVSGWTITHMDIGGYDVFNTPLPGFDFKRTQELQIRWHELGVFTSALQRGHESSLINGSAQFWDTDVLPYTKVLIDLFVGLAPYWRALLNDASTFGLPPVRHGVLVYPDDETWFSASPRPKHTYCDAGFEVGLQQFFLGDEVLVAPVLLAGASEVGVYLPEGEWVHFWSGQRAQGPAFGSWPAPLGQPAFFYKAGEGAEWERFFQSLVARFAPSLSVV